MNQERILVVGDYRQTITVVRSLARAGHHVTLGSHDPCSSTALSRHLSGLWSWPRDNPARFVRELEKRLRTDPPAFVFPVGESQLRALAPHARRLDTLTTWVGPAWPVLLQCFNKRAMFELCDAVSVPTRPWSAWRRQSGRAAWRRQALEHGFPVVIKRCDSSAHVEGRKALIIRDAVSLERFLQNISRDPDAGSLLMQAFATGVRHNCQFAADAGRITAYFEQRVVRTDTLDMTGIGIEGISVAPSAQLRDWCERITRALGYHGIGCIQFLVDEKTGSVSFLELNPRMDSTAALPVRLGYDFPRIAVELARRRRDAGGATVASAGGDFASTQALPGHAYALGRRYHWLYGDVLAWHEARKSGAAGPLHLSAWALRSLCIACCSHHLTWDVGDPLPTLHEYWKQLRGALARRAGLQPLATGYR